MAKTKKVPLNRLVEVETFDLVKAWAEKMNISEGVFIDWAVRHYVGAQGGDVVTTYSMAAETLELVRSLPDWGEVKRAVKEAGEELRSAPRLGALMDGEKRILQGMDEYDGEVSLPPIVENSHLPERQCLHHEGTFRTALKFATICPECKRAGHSGEPRDCPRCTIDYGTGAL